MSIVHTEPPLLSVQKGKKFGKCSFGLQIPNIKSIDLIISEVIMTKQLVYLREKCLKNNFEF